MVCDVEFPKQFPCVFPYLFFLSYFPMSCKRENPAKNLATTLKKGKKKTHHHNLFWSETLLACPRYVALQTKVNTS